MKLFKFSLVCSIIFLLIISILPLKFVLETEAACARVCLLGTLNKASYTVGEQVEAAFTASFTGSSPSSSKHLKFTSKLITQTNPNNPEYTVYENTYVGNSTWPIFGSYYYPAPPTAEGTFYVTFKAYDMNLGQVIEQVNTTVRPPSTPKPNPVVTVKANGVNPLTVSAGTSVRITWDATNNPTSCKRMDTGATVSTIGTTGFTEIPSGTKTYTIECSN